ncbi:MAG TPA: alpha/beta fold hydrolase [Bosea sp. (in: a-proteobacteria)]|uniref:alpha/beta fold hydrolase n=1 Tax=Bosea sp. (in: a-proteobacteria) TaxID=1871050 RepID=UPI002E0F541C|nr:alpha/beta fold hydrolase [Bosea sp. (in: a-proteobacteria)]
MLTRALLVLVLVVAGLVLWSEWLGAQAARAHPPTGHFVVVAGGRLHYREVRPSAEARGTVVLVHGASSDHADLLATLGPDLGHYRVVAIDRPGQGWSDRIAGDAMADPARQAEALMQALDQIVPERFVLVAHSLGGAAATRIALDRPERLRGLVLLGAVTHPWPGGIAWYHHVTAWPVVGPVFTRLVGVPGARTLLQAGAESVFAPRPVTRGYLEAGEISLLLRPAAFRANSQDIAAAFDFVSGQASRYRDLKMPVVAITGDSDAIVSPIIHSAAIARQAPQGRFVLLPGVGHMPHHAAPEIVVEAIDQIVGPRSGLALN